MWAFEALKMQPTEILPTKLIWRAENVTADFNAQSVANCLWAFATLPDLTCALGFESARRGHGNECPGMLRVQVEWQGGERRLHPLPSRIRLPARRMQEVGGR